MWVLQYPLEWVMLIESFDRVRIVVDTEFELEIQPSDTITRIKELIQEKMEIPPPQQTLVFNGQKMSDEKKLSEYGLGDGASVHLILSFRG